ncbi:MAG: ABC transporter ATP-binding protein [Lachnospiraceae bacterium]|nr:ABC transporter ATP-binding protein [Lachnospiraceae bacterium]
MKKLEVKNINKSFEDKPVLKDISIELGTGELVSLLGVSGSGKTTLFNVISGLLKPDSGEVFLDGKNITNNPGHISYMLQKDLLLPYKTIQDNVALPLVLKGMKKKEARANVSSMLTQFGLEGNERKYPAELSGGMRQRAALLRTYMFSREVALLDEPFSALDTITKTLMHKWYMDVMEEIKLSTLFVTHDIDEAIFLSDRIYILSGSLGEIVGEIEIKESRQHREDFNLTVEFLEYKRRILSML